MALPTLQRAPTIKISGSVLVSPSHTLQSPFIDPPNVRRAITIEEMISAYPTPSTQQITYNVGISAISFEPITYKIRNNTTNTSLKITLVPPEFLKINIDPIQIIQPHEIISFTVEFNEDDARNKSLTGTNLYNELFLWNIDPLNVNGPVYVSTNLTSLVPADELN